MKSGNILDADDKLNNFVIGFATASCSSDRLRPVGTP
jgi:hypothetical protein